MPQITPEERAAPQPVAPKVQAVVDAWNNLDPEHLLAIEYSSLGDAIAALYAVLPEAPKAPARSVVREFLLDYFTGEGDTSMMHSMIFAPSDFEAVRRTVEHFAVCVRWLRDDANKYDQERERANKAESAVRSAKQPLHKEMAALNQRVITLTATVDRLRAALAMAGVAEPPEKPRLEELLERQRQRKAAAPTTEEAPKEKT
jgi:hypothetical protein